MYAAFASVRMDFRTNTGRLVEAISGSSRTSARGAGRQCNSLIPPRNAPKVVMTRADWRQDNVRGGGRRQSGAQCAESKRERSHVVSAG